MTMGAVVKGGELPAKVKKQSVFIEELAINKSPLFLDFCDNFYRIFGGEKNTTFVF